MPDRLPKTTMAVRVLSHGGLVPRPGSRVGKLRGTGALHGSGPLLLALRHAVSIWTSCGTCGNARGRYGL